MASRTPQPGPALAALLAALTVVGGLLVAYGPGRGALPGGMTLGPDLAVAADSALPSDVVSPGDRLVGVAVQGDRFDEVTDLRSLTWHLGRVDGEGPVRVRIERAPTERSVVLSRDDLDADLPAELTGRFEAIRIDGLPALPGAGLDDIRSAAERAFPEPIEVVVVVSGAVEGPVTLVRAPGTALPGAWVLLAGLAAAYLTLAAGAMRRNEATRAADAALASVMAGGAGAAVIGALAAPMAPFWSVGVALGLVIVWRGRVSGLRAGVGVAGTLAALALGLAISGAALAPALLASRGVLDSTAAVPTVALALMAALAATDAVIAASGPRRWIGWLAGAELLCIAGAMIATLTGAAEGDASLVAGLAAVVLPWSAELVAAGRAIPLDAAAWAGRRADGGGGPNDTGSGAVAELLTRLAAAAGSRAVALAVGANGSFWTVRTGDDGQGEAPRPAPEVLEAALSILAAEGGMLPREEGEADADALAGVGSSCGLVAAVPFAPGDDDHPVRIFALVEGEADADAIEVARRVVDVCDQVDVAALRAEATLLVAGSAAVRLAGPAASPALGAADSVEPSRRAPADGPTPDPPAASTLRAASDRLHARLLDWARHESTRSYPVDDPEAFDARERAAIRYLAATDGAALVVGEPGVGKEFVARVIHHESARRDEPFVTVDCTTVPPALLELELFGDEEQPGLVEAVGSGTLLLKSVATVPSALLTAVLSRLDRAGGRLIVAERYRGPDVGLPNGLPEAIRRRVIERTLHLAPLRDRPGEIGRYARFFAHEALRRYAGVDGVAADLGDEVVAALATLPLAGNFVELRARVVAELLGASDGAAGSDEQTEGVGVGPKAEDVDSVGSSVGEGDAGASVPAGDDDDDPGSAEERQRIVEALRAAGGNRTVAAQQLGMTRGSLLRRLKRYGIR